MIKKTSMSEPLIRPFAGLLFNKEKIDDISQCVCPPYDIIPDPGTYYSRSAFNAIRLELPVATRDRTEYDEAAISLEEWLRERVLVPDETPTIYLYEQEFDVEGVSYVRRGIIPLVRLDRGRIFTHEETRKAAREDRERLIHRLKAFTSLIFSVYDDKKGETDVLLGSSDKEKIYDFTDELGIKNRFYRMKNTKEIEGLASLLEYKNIYIADGHHRLSVAFKLGLPYVAMYLTGMYGKGIVILPYHRTVRFRKERHLKDLLSLVSPFLSVEKVALEGADGLKRRVRQLVAGLNPSFALVSKDDRAHLYVLTQKEPFFTDQAVPESLRRLSVNVAHAGLLKGLFEIEDDEISFVKDAPEAVGQVNDGASDLALFVPATTVDEVKDVAEHRLSMPPKSTYFYPKILTGLVFHRYAQG
jgi:uncharacterized protein (DUF1015 family)